MVAKANAKGKGMSNTEIGLKAIAWLGVIFGGIGALYGLVFGVVFSLLPMDKMLEASSKLNGTDPAAMASFFRMERLLMLAAVPFYAAACSGGVGILKRRLWGRTAMECLFWASIVLSIAMAVALNTVIDVSTLMPFPKMPNIKAEEFAKLQEMMGTMMRVMSVISACIGSVILGGLIYFLRRPATRDWFGA